MVQYGHKTNGSIDFSRRAAVNRDIVPSEL
jgi:hypothetical protein